ncbi:DUF5074 domain-containing protein [Sinomicrobium soli]|uniref:DUF5074 domain-containing protein n=1 Tax=Sinomicrobium sp. N-1-3-6 TaxID=2219864 RepID=UPI000DCD4867|nr:DUF5074 domain-containing protein [Sinomicrobium sp. N-1-3-6]RAV30620.1 hypothetical protein DN748_03765 [Sinomicrobium sp. N-1-3-6]
MKHTRYIIRILCLLVFAGFVACDSDDDNFTEDDPSGNPGGEVEVPRDSVVIIEQKLQDTLTLGQTITLQPQWQSGSSVSCRWMIAGEEVGKDSVFTFEPAERGDYEISFTVTNDEDEAAVVYKIHTLGGYENGFFIVNEGWFGHGTGTLSFYRYDTGAVEDSVFVKANPDKDLLPVSSTLQFGTIHNEQLFLLSKVGGPLVVADAYSLKEKGRIPAQGGNDWRAFAGLDNSRGLVSSGNGLYNLNLEPLEMGSRVEGIDGQTGDLIKAGNHVFVLSQSQGAIILNASSLEIEKTIPGIVTGFAQTADGRVWMAGGTRLIGVEPFSLETVEVELGFQAHGSWGAWHPGSITAGDTEVYIAKNSAFSGGNEIYRYTGDTASLSSPFVTLPGERVTYGSGIGYDRNAETLVVNTVNKGFGESFSNNLLLLYDAHTAGRKEEKAYEGYYFPSVSVFHEE